jgi:hypothetical protein
MTVCIGLITYGRDDYTAATVRSFAEHNDIHDPRFRLVHVAEAGDTDAMCADVAAHGWETISRPKVQLGQMAAYRRVLEYAVNSGCEYTVINENDWVWSQPFPWWVLDEGNLDEGLGFETCRLFGVFKHKPPLHRLAGTKSLVTGKTVDWRPVVRGLEATTTHYVPLSITRTEVLAPWAAQFQGMKKMSRDRDLQSLRVTSNVVWSIGETHTLGMRE